MKNLKKIIILIISTLFIFSWINNVTYSADDAWSGSVSDFLDNHKADNLAWNSWSGTNNYWIWEEWFDSFKNKIISNVMIVSWLWAVAMIVFSGLMMVLAGWADEKVTKAKNMLKWSVLWLVWIIMAWWLANIIVWLFYSNVK